MRGPMRLVRYDVEGKEDDPEIKEILRENRPKNRNDLLVTYNLAEDCVVKLIYDGKLIPWSLVEYMSSIGAVDFQIFRPHQNVKPKTPDAFAPDGLVREKISCLDERIKFLEGSLHETALQFKTERDLQLLMKQIAFLARRLEEADQSDWAKKE